MNITVVEVDEPKLWEGAKVKNQRGDLRFIFVVPPDMTISECVNKGLFDLDKHVELQTVLLNKSRFTFVDEVKADFALKAIAPYYKDNSLCAHDGTQCLYLTPEGNKCVLGKYLLPDKLEKYKDVVINGDDLLNKFSSQEQVLIPEAVDVLTPIEWKQLQLIHDNIALDSGNNLINLVKALGLFTMEELNNFEA